MGKSPAPLCPRHVFQLKMSASVRVTNMCHAMSSKQLMSQQRMTTNRMRAPSLFRLTTTLSFITLDISLPLQNVNNGSLKGDQETTRVFHAVVRLKHRTTYTASLRTDLYDIFATDNLNSIFHSIKTIAQKINRLFVSP